MMLVQLVLGLSNIWHHRKIWSLRPCQVRIYSASGPRVIMSLDFFKLCPVQKTQLAAELWRELAGCSNADTTMRSMQPGEGLR